MPNLFSLLKNNKTALVCVLFTAAIMAGWLFYSVAGHAVINALYNAGVLEYFSTVLPSQSENPVTLFYGIFDIIFRGLWASFVMLCVILWFSFRPAQAAEIADEQDFADTAAPQLLGFYVALAAAAGLFLELAVIRIHSSFFQLFAYFKNVSLLSCFLGLGIGYSLVKRRAALHMVLPLLALEIVFMETLRSYTGGLGELFRNPISENFSFGLYSAQGIVQTGISFGFILVIFAFNALAFVPLGQLTGRLMDRMPNLRAYSFNLLGSLAGILAFTAFSFIATPPAVWIALGVFSLCIFLAGQPRRFAGSLIAAAAAITMLSVQPSVRKYDVYSPYQILTLELSRMKAPVIRASNAYFQRMLNVDDGMKSERHAMMHYQMPYLFSPEAADVLVVGSGSGNDVAAALQNTKARVDAVEIDPAIVRFGQELHPLSPYRSERVSVHITDARGYIASTDKKYDLIVYGLLDSHAMLSGRAGGLRLDSYVYTVEAFRQAKNRLRPNGVITLSFSFLEARVGRKILLLLTEVFGKPPVVFKTVYDSGYTFIASERELSGLALPEGMAATNIFENPAIKADLPTDDWPFFYMPVRQYPISYMVMIVLLLVISGLYIKRLVTGREPVNFSPVCFFLGAGFMLVETKAITELSLVYSSTWVTVSAASAGILAMAYLANLYVERRTVPPQHVIYGLVLASLGAGLLAAHFAHGMSSRLGAQALFTGVLALPVLFSGLAFSSRIKEEKSIASALASNLAGAMVGGFLEYNSMYTGFTALYYAAALMYAAAWYFAVKKR